MLCAITVDGHSGSFSWPLTGGSEQVPEKVPFLDY